MSEGFRNNNPRVLVIKKLISRMYDLLFYCPFTASMWADNDANRIHSEIESTNINNIIPTVLQSFILENPGTTVPMTIQGYPKDRTNVALTKVMERYFDLGNRK